MFKFSMAGHTFLGDISDNLLEDYFEIKDGCFNVIIELKAET